MCYNGMQFFYLPDFLFVNVTCDALPRAPIQVTLICRVYTYLNEDEHHELSKANAMTDRIIVVAIGSPTIEPFPFPE